MTGFCVGRYDHGMSKLTTALRAKCERCLRPVSHCLCASIPNIKNRIHVLILQHPDEAKHPLNTGRLAALGLQKAELLVGESFPELAARLTQMTSAFLLFPADEQSVVQPLVAMSNQDSALLVVPDGTWRNVRKIMQLNPVLHSLPRLSLLVGEPSQYRVRKAREKAAVSTIEAIVRSLNVLEPEQDFTPVLRPFQRLVEQQIQAMGPEIYQRHHALPNR